MLEKTIENQILNFLKGCGIFCWKVDRVGTFDPKKRIFRTNKNPHKLKGVSDIMAIIDGRMIAIEVKSMTGSLTEEQRLFLSAINNNGGLGFVSRSAISTAKELIKHFPTHLRIEAFIGRNSNLN
jgi:hypothetical protein